MTSSYNNDNTSTTESSNDGHVITFTQDVDLDLYYTKGEADAAFMKKNIKNLPPLNP